MGNKTTKINNIKLRNKIKNHSMFQQSIYKQIHKNKIKRKKQFIKYKIKIKKSQITNK